MALMMKFNFRMTVSMEQKRLHMPNGRRERNEEVEV